MVSGNQPTTSLSQLVVRGLMCRLHAGDPSSVDDITMPRELFDQLLAALSGATEACQLPAEPTVLKHVEGKWRATITSAVLGELTSEGRTVLEALARARREWDKEVERRIA